MTQGFPEIALQYCVFPMRDGEGLAEITGRVARRFIGVLIYQIAVKITPPEADDCLMDEGIGQGRIAASRLAEALTVGDRVKYFADRPGPPPIDLPKFIGAKSRSKRADVGRRYQKPEFHHNTAIRHQEF